MPQKKVRGERLDLQGLQRLYQSGHAGVRALNVPDAVLEDIQDLMAEVHRLRLDNELARQNWCRLLLQTGKYGDLDA